MKLTSWILYDVPTASIWGFYQSYKTNGTLGTHILDRHFQKGVRFGVGIGHQFRTAKRAIDNILTRDRGLTETTQTYLDGAFLAGYLYGVTNKNENQIATAVQVIGFGGLFEHISFLLSYPSTVNRIPSATNEGLVTLPYDEDQNINTYRPFARYGAAASILVEVGVRQHYHNQINALRSFLPYNLFMGKASIYSGKYEEAMEHLERNFRLSTFIRALWYDTMFFWAQACILENGPKGIRMARSKLDDLFLSTELSRHPDLYKQFMHLLDDEEAVELIVSSDDSWEFYLNEAGNWEFEAIWIPELNTEDSARSDLLLFCERLTQNVRITGNLEE